MTPRDACIRVFSSILSRRFLSGSTTLDRKKGGGVNLAFHDRRRSCIRPSTTVFEFDATNSSPHGNQNPTPILYRIGVHKLSCSNCPSVYIGQCGRSLRKRIYEHTLPWRKGRLSVKKARDNGFVDIDGSAFADHLINYGHTFNAEENVTLLHCIGKGKIMSQLESVEIVKYSYATNVTILNDIIHIDTVASTIYRFIHHRWCSSLIPQCTVPSCLVVLHTGISSPEDGYRNSSRNPGRAHRMLKYMCFSK